MEGVQARGTVLSDAAESTDDYVGTSRYQEISSAFSHTQKCARWHVFKLNVWMVRVYFSCVYTFQALFRLKTSLPLCGSPLPYEATMEFSGLCCLRQLSRLAKQGAFLLMVSDESAFDLWRYGKQAFTYLIAATQELHLITIQQWTWGQGV